MGSVAQEHLRLCFGTAPGPVVFVRGLVEPLLAACELQPSAPKPFLRVDSLLSAIVVEEVMSGPSAGGQMLGILSFDTSSDVEAPTSRSYSISH